MNYFNSFIKESFRLFSEQPTFIPDLDIAFAIDKNYLKPCGITLFSIAKNNQDLKINFHIFTTYFDSFGYDEIISQFKNTQIFVYILNTEPYDKLQVNGHFTTAIYYRLSIANIFKDKLDKFIYLDADILCISSLKEICSINIDNKVLAAVQDKCMKPTYIESIGLNPNDKYFNSGVLLINTKEWNNFDVLTKFNTLISKRDYKFPDQDVLNILLKNKMIFIDQKFNYFTRDDISPALIHFVSSPKPWSIAASHGELYLKYYYQSPWKDQPLDAPKNSKEAKKFAKILWRKGKYLASIQWYILYIQKKLS